MRSEFFHLSFLTSHFLPEKTMAEIQFNTGVIRPVECFKEGWELIKDQYWLLFAVALVGALLAGVSMYILMGAMACGVCLCYFRAIDGKQVQFDDLFKGFSYLGRSLLLLVFIILPIIIFSVAVTIPMLIAVQDIEAVGRYGLRFRWSDGHDTGIYSFDILRHKFCRCSMCKAREKK